MIGGVQWDNVNIAGAFILGAVLATVATIAIVRAVGSVLRDQRRRDRYDG